MTNLSVEKRLKANIDIPMPENTVTKQNVRLWREHYIYCSAQADAYHTMLELFEGSMKTDLKEWLVGAMESRRSDADVADKNATKNALKVMRSEQTNDQL